MQKKLKRTPAEGDIHARVRRPLTREMIRVMEESIGEWGIRGRIGWIIQSSMNQLLLRATELLAEEGWKLLEGWLLGEEICGLLR